MQYNMTVHRIVKQRKRANEYIEKHSHEFFHWIYCLDGIGSVIVNSEPIIGQKYSLIMISPGVEHAIYGVDDFLSFDIKFSCDTDLTDRLSRLGYCINQVSDYEDQLIKNLFDEAVCARDYFEEIINLRILELIFRILRRSKAGIYMTSNKSEPSHLVGPGSREKKGVLREVLHYIDSHITEPIRVADLAEICGYSCGYFSTFFKEEAGCTPIRYINGKKVELAKTMMMSTDLNVTQISDALGFESVHYFSRVFKKMIGMPPINYYKRTNINMGINVIKDSAYTPSGQYEIPIKSILS